MTPLILQHFGQPKISRSADCRRAMRQIGSSRRIFRMDIFS
jgi:hypothetical protein